MPHCIQARLCTWNHKVLLQLMVNISLPRIGHGSANCDLIWQGAAIFAAPQKRFGANGLLEFFTGESLAQHVQLIETPIFEGHGTGAGRVFLQNTDL